MKRILSGFLAGLMILSVAFSLPFTAQAARKHQHNIVSSMNSNETMQYKYCNSSVTGNDNIYEDYNEYYSPSSHKKWQMTPERSVNNYKVYTYGNNLNEYYEYKAKGAQQMRVDFYIDVEPNCDFVEFYDANDKLVKKYSYRDANETKLQSLTFMGSSFKIRMTSDRSNTKPYRGFRIDNIYVIGGRHGYPDSNDEKAYFCGPSTPDLQVNNYESLTYGNNVNQYYNYHCKGAKKIMVTVAIDVEPNYDFVEFYDMKGNLVKKVSYRDYDFEERDWQENQYTSGGKVQVVTFDGNAFQIRLTSDGSNTKDYKGFRILSCRAIADPVKTMNTGDYTMITPKEDYPESPHEYSNYANLTYAYRYPNAKSLKVKFSDQCKTEVTYDTITVRDEQGNTIGTYSGTQLSGKTLDIPTGSFSIKLQSDRSRTFYGFSIDSIEATMASNPLYTTGRYSEAYSNEITPRTAHPYGNYANETYYYTDATATSIDLQFDQVCKTEKNWDFITIRNKNGKQIAKLSGDQASNKFINIPGNSFSITFTSDRSKTFYGYSLYYVSPNYGKAHEGNNIYAYPESGHNYDNYANQTYKYVCPLDHVKALDLTFSDKCMTEENYDIVSVYDKNNNLIGSYSGKMLAGKSLRVPGNEFTIKFKTDRSRAYYGFSFDDISAVFDCDYMKVNELKHDYVLTQTINSNGTTEKVYACKNCQDIKKDVNLNFERLTFNLGDNVFKYDGKDHKPAIEVKDGNTVLKEGVNYELSYSDTKNVGTQKMTVKMLGKYSGTKEFEYIIYENTATKLSLTPSPHAFTAKVDNTVKDAKYELMYSKNSNFTDAKTVQFTNSDNTMVTGLDVRTTYYVKARYSLEINGKTYYSDYGNVFNTYLDGTYDPVSNLKVSMVDETNKAWGMNVTWDAVPGAEGYEVLIKGWDYDWCNSEMTIVGWDKDNKYPVLTYEQYAKNYPVYTNSEILEKTKSNNFGNNVVYSTNIVEQELPTSREHSDSGYSYYDYFENFYYNGVGYYTTKTSFKTLQNFADNRRYTVSVRPVFEKGTQYGAWSSSLKKTTHKSSYTNYSLPSYTTQAKNNVIKNLKNANTKVPELFDYSKNISFVDIGKYLDDDVYLENLSRKLNDADTTDIFIARSVNDFDPNGYWTPESYAKLEFELLEGDKPWVEFNGMSDGEFYNVFEKASKQAKSENWGSMRVYYFWSELEGAINLNCYVVNGDNFNDPIGKYLKSIGKI